MHKRGRRFEVIVLRSIAMWPDLNHIPRKFPSPCTQRYGEYRKWQQKRVLYLKYVRTHFAHTCVKTTQGGRFRTKLVYSQSLRYYERGGNYRNSSNTRQVTSIRRCRIPNTEELVVGTLPLRVTS